MKTIKVVFFTVILFVIFFFIILFGICWGDVLQYKQIGNTHFYLVETFANTASGHPIAGLSYRFSNSDNSFEGVSLHGFPNKVWWNDNHLIVKTSQDGNSEIIGYYIIQYNQNSLDLTDCAIHEFSNEDEFKCALMKLGLDESRMDSTDSTIPWSLHLFD